MFIKKKTNKQYSSYPNFDSRGQGPVLLLSLQVLLINQNWVQSTYSNPEAKYFLKLQIFRIF